MTNPLAVTANHRTLLPGLGALPFAFAPGIALASTTTGEHPNAQSVAMGHEDVAATIVADIRAMGARP